MNNRFEITHQSVVSDIVSQDFRTADVFRKHGISYCCGGKWPIEMACQMQGVDIDLLESELAGATRTIEVSNVVDFSKWDTGFLIDYIINIHHHYLRETLPSAKEALQEFVNEHKKKFTYLSELEDKFNILAEELLDAARSEEEVLFPYIKQLVQVHKHKEPYAAMFIRTLRKPVEEILYKSHNKITKIILDIRKLTNQYTTPENVCISHKVVLAKLRELDNDLMQHIFLERNILFPRAIQIEKEVLNSTN